jgi:hypothetical protein
MILAATCHSIRVAQLLAQAIGAIGDGVDGGWGIVVGVDG